MIQSNSKYHRSSLLAIQWVHFSKKSKVKRRGHLNRLTILNLSIYLFFSGKHRVLKQSFDSEMEVFFSYKHFVSISAIGGFPSSGRGLQGMNLLGAGRIKSASQPEI